jgi:hypothetical protein
MKWRASIRLAMRPTEADMIKGRQKAPLFHAENVEQARLLGREMVIRDYIRTSISGIAWSLK